LVIILLKQRASQLRNTPFSGESTDSSDNESSAGDYCTPPDELAATGEDSQVKEKPNKVLERTTQVLKTCATYTTVSLKKVNYQSCNRFILFYCIFVISFALDFLKSCSSWTF